MIDWLVGWLVGIFVWGIRCTLLYVLDSVSFVVVLYVLERKKTPWVDIF